jgi:hypothetical protein
MTVYVDDMDAPYRRMVMNHLFSDSSLEELHAMADKIGVSRRWFQNKGRTPHYDCCKSKKALALKFGAVEVGYGTARWMGLIRKAARLKEK